MTETPTDTMTTGHRAALVEYYERRRAKAQRNATQAQRIATHAQIEADEMAVLGSTVRVLGDAAVADEYRRVVLGER